MVTVSQLLLLQDLPEQRPECQVHQLTLRMAEDSPSL